MKKPKKPKETFEVDADKTDNGDAIDHDPETQAKLLEASQKVIEKTNPALHKILQKYKNGSDKNPA